MYVFMEALAGRVWPRQPAHKADVVWASPAGRKLHREQKFQKSPPSVGLIWQAPLMCVYVCLCALGYFPSLSPHVCHVVEARAH